MARGLEDTALYVYNRLLSLNEVGGDADRFGVSPEELPHLPGAPGEMALGLLSPVDTIPSAVRMCGHGSTSCRNSRTSGRPACSAGVISTPRTVATSMTHRSPMPTRSTCSTRPCWGLAARTLLAGGIHHICRTHPDRMFKVLREAKVHTSWINPNPAYEGGTALYSRVLDTQTQGKFLDDFLSSSGVSATMACSTRLPRLC